MVLAKDSGGSCFEVSCRYCGEFIITDEAISTIDRDEQKKDRLLQLLGEWRIKSLFSILQVNGNLQAAEWRDALKQSRMLITNSRNINHDSPCPITIAIDDLLKRYPVLMTKKLERALVNIAHCILSDKNGENFSISEDHPSEYIFFARNLIEMRNHQQLLLQANWCSFDKYMSEWGLTPAGWQKYEELEKDWQNSNTAFIAMWFNDSTKAYREAVRKAMEVAGYDEPVFIDTYQHNNFIMDEVISKINEARFVVADFTCLPEKTEEDGKITCGVRGGVYFEAGYARGLGKEVIMTCKNSDDAKKRRHFDIDQVNTLFWDDNGGTLSIDGEDFIKLLAWRIMATVGRGKNPTRN